MRTGLFVDGSNFHASAKLAQYHIDYSRVIKLFGDNIVTARYYTAILNDETGWSQIRPLIDWLDFNGWKCVTKPTKSMIDELTNLTVVKGNMDVEIATDMMKMSSFIDHAVLFSGDGDFTYVVKALQDRGVRVTVVSMVTMTAEELRRAADKFIDICEPEWRQRLEKRHDAKTQIR